MWKLIAFLIPLALAAQNTAKYPNAVASSADLGIAGNRAETSLLIGVNSTATTLSVASGSQFKPGMYVSIDNEFVAICNVSGNSLTVGRSSCPNVDGRGLDTANGGGAASSHLASAKVQARISAWHQNQSAAEIGAVEDTLLNGIPYDFKFLKNVSIDATLSAKNLPFYVTAPPYNAKGDCVANDTAAVQSAVNAALVKGGTVIFSPGCYLLDTISLPSVSGKAAPTLAGTGKWAVTGTSAFSVTTELRSNSAVPMFLATTGSSGYTIRDLYLNGNSVGTYGWYGDGKESFCKFERLLVRGFTASGMQVTGGLNEITYSYFTANNNGVDMGSDGRFVGNHVISNTGYGMTVIGGTFTAFNEVAWNGSYGIWVNQGSLPNNLDHEITGNYIEANQGTGIYVLGNSLGSASVSKIKIHHNYVSTFAEGGAVGIYVKNANTVQIDGINFLGDSNYAAVGLQAIVLENSTNCQITNVVSDQAAKNVIKVISSYDSQISTINATSTAAASTSTDDSYGIYIDPASARIRLANINIVDPRSPGYSRGIKNLGASTVLLGYSLYTPVASPDSLGTAKYAYFDLAGVFQVGGGATNISGNTSVAGNLSVTGTETVSGAFGAGSGTATAGFSGRNINIYNAGTGPGYIVLRDDNNSMNVLGYAKPTATTVTATMYGKWTSDGVLFSALGTGTLGSIVWCKDCAVAPTCTGGGSGAWAFGTAGAPTNWTCPF